MPWSGKSFKSRHNHKLSASQAKGAARQANAMLREGVPEGIAIATANKHAESKGRQTTPEGRKLEKRLAARDKK